MCHCLEFTSLVVLAWESGQLVGKSAGRVIERFRRVRIPAEATGEISSPESTLCADFFLFGVHSTPVLP